MAPVQAFQLCRVKDRTDVHVQRTEHRSGSWHPHVYSVCSRYVVRFGARTTPANLSAIVDRVECVDCRSALAAAALAASPDPVG